MGHRAHLGEDEARSWGRPDVGTDDGASQRFRHDLRQPLAAASLLLEDVANMPSLETVAVARLREAQRQVYAALDMLHAEELGGPVVDVVEIGEAIADDVLSSASRCEVRLVRRRAAHVLVDPVGLLRTVRNLVDNAVHAATSVAGDALVRVTVDQWGDEVVLSVDDSGPGFGHVAPRNGHGLVSVRRFVERWGGTIAFGSSPLGGAHVDVRLPCAVGAPVEAPVGALC
jgi:signal transduction histidine kinase